MSTKKEGKTRTKPAVKASKSAGRKASKLSALDAAAQVLGEEGRSMNCKELIETMATKGYWKSPAGKTPASTLYAALLKEVTTKGKESRFAKVDRGQFALRQRA
jgi:hypothetical protein